MLTTTDQGQNNLMYGKLIAKLADVKTKQDDSAASEFIINSTFKNS